jgi:hypothetical protein
MSIPSFRHALPRLRGKSSCLLITLGALLIAPIHPGIAGTNLVTNGIMAVTGGTASFQFGTYGGYAPTETLNGWTSAGGYNFVFLPTSTVATGVDGALSLWSPVSTPAASANGFTNAGPTGGNFIGGDSVYGQAAITQTISGLTVGQGYQLSFAWAGAQQSGFTAVNGTTEFWSVSLGSQTYNTPTISVPNEGFSGWMNQTFFYTATATSETLSFFATGTPSGVPPFALFTNVSLQVPEPASTAIMVTGILGLIAFGRRRRGSWGAVNSAG